MEHEEMTVYFFRRRWPNGFECPACGYGLYYVIQTRRLPLYQCRFCGRQTTVTAGTVMNRSRTSLEKWAAALELLAGSNGINATQLASSIGVKHKTAWLMLRKIRSAISEAESETRLRGPVQAAVQWLAPGYLFLSASHKRYRKERIVLIGAAVGPNREPTSLKLNVVDDAHLDPGTKELTRSGARAALQAIASEDAELLVGKRLVQSSLPSCFKEAGRWLNRTFNGIGSKYLQNYLDEYCFRWNLAARGSSPMEAWGRLLLFRAQFAGESGFYSNRRPRVWSRAGRFRRAVRGVGVGPGPFSVLRSRGGSRAGSVSEPRE